MSGVISDNTVRSSGVVAPLSSATLDANDPARDTNPTDGVGTKWINTTSGQIFVCINATTDANQWIGQTKSAIQSRGFSCAGYSDYLNEHNFSSPGKIADMEYWNPSTLGDAQAFGNLISANQYFLGTSNGINDRGIFGGGCTAAMCPTNEIQYFTQSTGGFTVDFGNLTEARTYGAAASNGTTDRATWGGGGKGSDVKTNTIDYVTISSTGNAADLGDLTQARDYCSGLDNGTNDRGIEAGGRTNPAPPNAHTNGIDYWTISTTANASDFGDLTNTRMAAATCSNDTNNRGLFMAGSYGGSYANNIDYITINTTGNATDFGDMAGVDPPGYPTANGARGHSTGTSNGTAERGFMVGGYTSISGTESWYKQIEYVTISTPGNSAAFGNLILRVYGPGCCNNTFG